MVIAIFSHVLHPETSLLQASLLEPQPPQLPQVIDKAGISNQSVDLHLQFLMRISDLVVLPTRERRIRTLKNNPQSSLFKHRGVGRLIAKHGQRQHWFLSQDAFGNSSEATVGDHNLDIGILQQSTLRQPLFDVEQIVLLGQIVCPETPYNCLARLLQSIIHVVNERFSGRHHASKSNIDDFQISQSDLCHPLLQLFRNGLQHLLALCQPYHLHVWRVAAGIVETWKGVDQSQMAGNHLGDPINKLSLLPVLQRNVYVAIEGVAEEAKIVVAVGDAENVKAVGGNRGVDDELDVLILGDLGYGYREQVSNDDIRLESPYLDPQLVYPGVIVNVKRRPFIGWSPSHSRILMQSHRLEALNLVAEVCEPTL